MRYENEEINEEKLEEMYMTIRLEEANNLRTNKRTDAQMINRIASIIKGIIEKEKKNEI